MSETWVWNESIGIPYNSDTFDINFVCDNVEYNKIHIGGDELPGKLVGLFYDSTRVYVPDTPGWIRNEYKTITFATPPTGDLLTYLQANATKQATSTIGLKNLSSYNQDLSVPRKKDLDALETNVQTQLNDKVPTTRTVNNKALSSNITLSASDVGALPNVPVTTTNNSDMLMVVNGNWTTDHGETGIQNASSLIVNKWPDNLTIILRSFRRWGKLCLFTVQFNVGTAISTNYGFTLLEMPYTSIDRVWINNQTQFFMDAGNVAVRVNNDNLATGNYTLTGFYLTTDNAKVIS